MISQRRAVARVGAAVLLAVALAATGCSSAGTSSSDAGPTSQTAAASGSSTSTAATSPAAGSSSSAASATSATGSKADHPSTGSGAAEIAALKAKVQGTKISMGSAGFPNPTLVGIYKVVDLMQADYGVTIDFKLMDSSPLNAALIGGKVHVGQVSLGGMAAAFEAGADLVAFAGDDQKNIFTVAAPADITSLDQVKGKRFAVSQNLSSIVGQTATKCLSKAGLDIEKDVQLFYLSNVGQIIEGLLSHSVDAGMSATFRDVSLAAKEPGKYHTLCNGWETNPQLNDVLVASRSWVKENPDLALAFALTELKVAQWTKEDPQGWQEFAMSKLKDFPADQAASNYQILVDQLDNWPLAGSLDKTMCQYTLDTSYEFGVLTKKHTCSDLVTFDYQDKAKEVMGIS